MAYYNIFAAQTDDLIELPTGSTVRFENGKLFTTKAVAWYTKRADGKIDVYIYRRGWKVAEIVGEVK